MFTLHLIAERPSHGTQHVDPVNGRELSQHPTHYDALWSGREYLREHPEAWLQVQDEAGNATDVAPV